MKLDKTLFWPNITNLEEAKKSCQRASIVSFIIAGITLLISLLSLTNISLLNDLGIDLYNILDSIFYLIIGLFILKCSRVASILGFSLYSWERVSLLVSGDFSSSYITIIFIVFFIGAIRGAFYYQKNKITEKRKKSRLPLILVTSFCIIVLTFITLIIMWDDNDDVYTDITLSNNRKELLYDLKILSENETVDLIYSDGLFKFDDKLFIITNENIIMYEEDWEQKIYKEKISNILSVNIVDEESDDYVTMLKVDFKNDHYYQYYVTKTNDGDKKFISKLNEIISINGI